MQNHISQNKADRLWSTRFIMLLLVNLFNGMAGFSSIPLVAKYAMNLGADITLASTISGMLSLVSLVVCPFAGILSDRVNRKWLLIISNCGYGVCLALHAFAPSVSVLMLLRCVTGVFFSILSVAAIAYATAFVPKTRTGEGLGYVSLVGILAQAAGPAIGLALQERYSYSATFIVSGIFGFLCMLTVLLMPYQDESEYHNKKKFSFNDLFAVEFLGFMLLAALFSSCNGLVSTYLSIIADERGIANISIFFTAYSVCLVITKPFVGKLLDKKGIFLILIPSVVAAALGMVFIGFGYSLTIMVVASIFKALGQGSGTPSMQAYAVKRLDKSRAGVAASTIQIGQNVGNALAPILGSFFVESYGYEKMFAGFGGFIILAGVTVILVQRMREKA